MSDNKSTPANTVPPNVSIPAKGKKDPLKLSDSIAGKFKLEPGFEASRVMFPGGDIIDLATGTAEQVETIIAAGLKIPHITKK